MIGKKFVFFVEGKTNGNSSITNKSAERLKKGAYFIKKSESIFDYRPAVICSGNGIPAEKSFKAIKEILKISERIIDPALNLITSTESIKREIFKLWRKPKMKPYNVFMAILHRETLLLFLKTFEDFTEAAKIKSGSVCIIENQWKKTEEITIIT
jgi:hypothetical protein